MTEQELSDFPKLISLIWGRLMMKKHYDGAALAAMLGIFIAREEGNQELADGSTSLMLKAVDELREEGSGTSAPSSAKPACSFCGRSEPDIHLAAGARAFICNSCVATLKEVFDAESDKRA